MKRITDRLLVALAVLGLVITFDSMAGCGSSLTTNQRLVQTTEVTLQAASAALGAWDLDHQHAVLAQVVANHGTLADFQAQIKTYRDARAGAVEALQEALAAASDAAKNPTEATLATLAINSVNFYNRVRALGLAVKGPSTVTLPPKGGQ